MHDGTKHFGLLPYEQYPKEPKTFDDMKAVEKEIEDELRDIEEELGKTGLTKKLRKKYGKRKPVRAPPPFNCPWTNVDLQVEHLFAKHCVNSPFSRRRWKIKYKDDLAALTAAHRSRGYEGWHRDERGIWRGGAIGCSLPRWTDGVAIQFDIRPQRGDWGCNDVSATWPIRAYVPPSWQSSWQSNCDFLNLFIGKPSTEAWKSQVLISCQEKCDERSVGVGGMLLSDAPPTERLPGKKRRTPEPKQVINIDELTSMTQNEERERWLARNDDASFFDNVANKFKDQIFMFLQPYDKIKDVEKRRVVRDYGATTNDDDDDDVKNEPGDSRQRYDVYELGRTLASRLSKKRRLNDLDTVESCRNKLPHRMRLVDLLYPGSVEYYETRPAAEPDILTGVVRPSRLTGGNAELKPARRTRWWRADPGDESDVVADDCIIGAMLLMFVPEINAVNRELPHSVDLSDCFAVEHARDQQSFNGKWTQTIDAETRKAIQCTMIASKVPIDAFPELDAVLAGIANHPHNLSIAPRPMTLDRDMTLDPSRITMRAAVNKHTRYKDFIARDREVRAPDSAYNRQEIDGRGNRTPIWHDGVYNRWMEFPPTGGKTVIEAEISARVQYFMANIARLQLAEMLSPGSHEAYAREIHRNRSSRNKQSLVCVRMIDRSLGYLRDLLRKPEYRTWYKRVALHHYARPTVPFIDPLPWIDWRSDTDYADAVKFVSDMWEAPTVSLREWIGSQAAE